MPILGTNGSAAAVYRDVDTFIRPRPRTRGTLLSVAREIPDAAARNLAGVTWTPWPAVAATREAVDCDEVYDKSTIRDVPDLAAQPPFLMWDRIQCSTAGLELDWLVEAAQQGIDDFVTVVLAAELETATASGGVGLVGNATYTPTVLSSTAERLGLALVRLEGYLAQGSKWDGAVGVIHLTPGLLTIAAQDGLVMWDPSAGNMGCYVTATGHCVVGDAGHTGQTGPQGQSGAGTDEAWIYATGDVWYALGSIPQMSVTDPTDPDGGPVYIGQNKHRPLLERAGLVAFDPEVIGATLVDITAAP